MDDGDPHGKVMLIFPCGKVVGFGECDGVEMDTMRAQFVADAVNVALKNLPENAPVLARKPAPQDSDS